MIPKKPSHGAMKAAAKPRKHPQSKDFAPYAPVDFRDVEETANRLAEIIETRFEQIAHILLEYESYEVVCDEIERTLDILRNLRENKAYFKTRIGEVAAFLPRNQPLYALTCFVIVPSLQASSVHFRIPHSMRRFFPKLLTTIDFYELFPNITVSNKERTEFLTERTALRVDPKTGETRPVTEAVIFTGTSAHADQLRMVFDERTLFISNGSGHNPVVVAKDAKLQKAVEAILTLQLYNQGQDCAAPNAILVHKDVFKEFLRLVRDEIRTVRVGQYSDRSCRVGPISDPKDLVRVQELLIRNREWLDPTTPGIIRAHDAILEPTIIVKPLRDGGNFTEVFAPAMFLQQYDTDAELARYFEDQAYAPNAMYVTVYGTSPYVTRLIGRKVGGKLLHDKTTYLKNTHLHAPGQERGTEPYGGYGYGASSFSIGGKITPKPTLPQREIYEQVAKPQSKGFLKKAPNLARFTRIETKDVQKLLRMKARSGGEGGREMGAGVVYVDTQGIDAKKRYIAIDESNSNELLPAPNAAFIAKLHPADAKLVRELRAMLMKKKTPSLEAFSIALYALPKKPGASNRENRDAQLRFFQTLYELLLGEKSGPRLAQFLLEIDRKKACELLDV